MTTDAVEPIDWKAAMDGSRPVTTRDGRKVTLYCVDAPGPDVLHGRIDGRYGPISWYEGGRLWIGRESVLDLIQPPPAPKPFRREIWVNVYRNNDYTVHSTKELADKLGGLHRLACVCTVVEGHEGDGL